MSTSRQLAAILFADIEGYTALMQRDETKAVLLRDKFQKTLEKEIRLRGGRVAVFSGDGALCVFKSAIEAVLAAVAVQSIMRREPVVPLRIGIHTGDVITEGKNVYGDGVNVASRIESFAVPGSVFISGKVADEIKNQPGIEIVSLERFALKNVHSPVEIFAVKNESLVVPKKEILEGKGDRIKKKAATRRLFYSAAALLLLIAISIFAYRKFGSAAPTTTPPSMRTIAVIPFTNLSGQKEDDYFADGVCDEILAQLSKINALNVLPGTSTLQFRNTKKATREIGDQIGATILLRGSVQKSNGKVRIAVQLIDAARDKNLWAETYVRDLKDVFSIQSDIAAQIVDALNATITASEEEQFSERPTDNMEAFDLLLRGNKFAEDYYESTRMDKVPDAVRMFEEAIRLDPKFLNAYAALISLYIEVGWRKPITNYEVYMQMAKQWLDKMIALKIDKPILHHVIALFKYEGERDYEGSLAELELIDRYYHNDKQTIGPRAYVLRRMGRLEEALPLFLRIARTYPKDATAHSELADTYNLLRNADSAVYHADISIQLRRNIATYYLQKASYYSNIKGDIRMAKETVRSASPFVDTAELRGFRLYLSLLDRNYAQAIHMLTQSTDSFYLLSQSFIVPNAQELAILLNNAGDKAGARAQFQRSLDMTTHLLQLHPEDFRLHSALGIAWAGLGEKEKAVAEGTKARDMMSVSTDAVIGIAPMQNLALIYTLLGEQDNAIDILEQLLKMPFGWGATNTTALYKTHPDWKLLQNNPRFQKLIQQ